VLFDVGYTLLDETPRLTPALEWLAEWLTARGLPTTPKRLRALYLEACLAPRQGVGGLLAQTAMAAGATPEQAKEQRRALPWDAVVMPPYPDALDALRLLTSAGIRVGVLANQPASALQDLEKAGLVPLIDRVWLSAVVGLEKPDPAFFRLALQRWDLPAARVAYVGDRPDNDVAPARALGMYAVRVRLGPHANQPENGPDERADHDARTLSDAARWLLGWRPREPARPWPGPRAAPWRSRARTRSRPRRASGAAPRAPSACGGGR
jgi:HAD superfamily hydrolase (TIGR01509 family)